MKSNEHQCITMCIVHTLLIRLPIILTMDEAATLTVSVVMSFILPLIPYSKYKKIFKDIGWNEARICFRNFLRESVLR